MTHKKKPPRVAIIMGSKSDYPIMKDAGLALKEFSISFDFKIISAHRTPDFLLSFAKNAHEKYSLIIAGAGGAAHLPGMAAASTPLPVIGVPVAISALKGLDALLSIVQMPKGVPVATVAINQAWNAGLLAAQILSIQDSKIQLKILKYKNSMKKKVLKSKLK